MFRYFTKVLFYAFSIAVALTFVACNKEDVVVEHEKFEYQVGDLDDIVIDAPERVKMEGLMLEVNHRERPSQPLSHAFDGSLSTLYHSPWQSENPPTEFPVIITVTLPDNAPAFEYMLYWPRQQGTNGVILSWRVSISIKDEPGKFIKILETNYSSDNAPKKIFIPEQYRGKLKMIELYITEGMNDFVAIQLIEFYNAAVSSVVPDVFTDRSCSELGAGVTREDILAIENSVYRNLALSLYDVTYDMRRVGDYTAFPSPDIMARHNKTGTYSILDHATGIFVEKHEYLLVFVDGLQSNASLRIMDHDISGAEGWTGQNVVLRNGPNKIKSNYTGLVYLLFMNDHQETIRLNVASAYVNGVYDINDPERMEWSDFLQKARASRVDVLGHYSHLIFPPSDFMEHTGNPERLVEVYDSIVLLQQEFIGLYKYDRTNKSRMLFRCTPSAAYMHATAFRTEYNPSTMDILCDEVKLRHTHTWGPAHEAGHIHQTRPGFRWHNAAGQAVLTEVSVNVYTMHVQRIFGNGSRLMDRGWYDAAYQTFMVDGIRHMDAVGAVDTKYFWEQLVHFWQLELYFNYVKGQQDFYKDLHEQIRNAPDPARTREPFAFAYLASKASNYNLSGFFNRYGYELDAQAVADIDRLGLPYPEQPLWYVNDNNLDLFRDRATVVQGQATRVGHSFVMSGWSNVLAFEVRVDGILKHISSSNQFTAILPEGIVTVDAIGADGSVHSVTL